MFRTVPLSIIRSFSLYTQQYIQVCWQLASKPSANLYDIYHCCVQWKTPVDGQKNCPKRVEFYSKNKFEKLVYLKTNKVKWSCYRASVAQWGGRGIALLLHDRGTRKGWVVSSTPQPHFTLGKTWYPFYRRLDGPWSQSGRVENLVPTGIWSRTIQTVVSHYTDWATHPTISASSWFYYKNDMLHCHHTSRPAVCDCRLALNSVGKSCFASKNRIVLQTSLQDPVSNVVGFGHEFLLWTESDSRAICCVLPVLKMLPSTAK